MSRNILDLFKTPSGFSAAGSDFAARSVVSTVAAASVPANRASLAILTDAVKATGELPATPPRRHDSEGLSTRNVGSDPLGDWYLNLPSKIPPKQIDSILRMALAGNIWQQSQLARLMGDSWPMFAKCQFELRAAIASAKYVVHPYSEPGKNPTPSAKEKAGLVRKALEAFEPDRFADEDACNGMIFDLTDAIINGVSVCELIWNEDETAIRASAWVHPRNLAFTPDGRLGVAYAAESGNMSFSNQVRNDVMDNPDKFLVARFKSKSGSCLGAGWMRKLAAYWVMIVYGRDFFMHFAQKYGNPFFDLSYDSGITDKNEIDKFERFAAMAANQGWLVHPNNSEVKVGPAHGTGTDNAQLAMMRLADEQCQMLMLGQTLTSSAPKNGGSRAQGDVHENVRQERLEEHCKWIARDILKQQFAMSLLRQNYVGSAASAKAFKENPECPTIEPDFTRPLSALEQADYMAKMSTSRVPVDADETYKRAGCQRPEPGREVLIGGELVIMEEPVTQTEKKQKDFDTQLAQQLQVNESLGEAGQGGGEFGEREVSAALAAATPGERLELENLVSAAERAPHWNGEAGAVKAKLKELVTKSRK